jgi:hypothetical protein
MWNVSHLTQEIKRLRKKGGYKKNAINIFVKKQRRGSDKNNL